MMTAKAKKAETTKVELLDVELAFIWQCVMNAQIPTTAAEVTVSVKQKLGPLVQALAKKQQQAPEEE